MTRLLRMPLSAALAFVVASGLSATRGETLTFPAVASAAGSCSLAPLVCANDSSPGCETICAGEQNAVCVEGTCSTAGNIVTPNRCSCR